MKMQLNQKNQLQERLCQTFLRYRWVYFALSVMTLVGLGLGIKNLGFTNAYEAQFGPNNPQLAAYNQLIDDYDQVDNVLIAIEPHSGDVFQPSVLELVNKLTKLAWKTPHSIRVDSLSNYNYTHSVDEDLVSEPLFEMASTYTKEEIDLRANEALHEPSLRNSLVAENGKVTGVNITIALPRKNMQAEVTATMGYINQTLVELGAEYPQINFRLAGKIAQDKAFFEASGTDSTTLFPLLVLVIFVVVFFILRNVLAGVALLVMVVGCTLATLGAFGWQQILLTPETLSAAIMIIPLGIADCVHLFLTYSKTLEDGENKQAAMEHTIILNFKSIVITSVTTAIGFLSLVFAESPSFQLMGYMVAIGVLLTLILSFTFFVPLLFALPAPKRTSRVGPKVATWINSFIHKKTNAVLAVLVICTLVMMLGLGRNELNQNTAEYFTPEMTYRQDIEWIDANLTGINNIQFSIPVASSMKVTDPEYLNNLEKFTQWLKQQDNVVNASSFSDVMKKVNMVMNNNNAEHYRIQQDSYISAQYLTMYEMSLPYGMGITNLINFDKSTSRVNVSLHISSNKELIAFDRKAQAWLAANTPNYMHTAGTSADIMYAYQLQYNIPGISSGIYFSLGLILVVMIYALNSVRLGLISLVPNILPILAAFGVWGFYDGQIGLAVAIVMGMTFGIVVDDTVHYINKYHWGRIQLNLNKEQAIKHALDTASTAMISTTVAISAGFMVLTASKFTPTADLGILTALIVILALVFDIIFLPALLLKTEK